MTATQLQAIAFRHGHQVVLGKDGLPALGPTRPGAGLPYRVLCLFKSHRHLFVTTPGANREEGEEFQKCDVCKATVNLEFAPCFNPEISPEMFGCTLGPTNKPPHRICPYRGDLS